MKKLITFKIYWMGLKLFLICGLIFALGCEAYLFDGEIYYPDNSSGEFNFKELYLSIPEEAVKNWTKLKINSSDLNEVNKGRDKTEQILLKSTLNYHKSYKIRFLGEKIEFNSPVELIFREYALKEYLKRGEDLFIINFIREKNKFSNPFNSSFMAFLPDGLKYRLNLAGTFENPELFVFIFKGRVDELSVHDKSVLGLPFFYNGSDNSEEWFQKGVNHLSLFPVSAGAIEELKKLQLYGSSNGITGKEGVLSQYSELSSGGAGSLTLENGKGDKLEIPPDELLTTSYYSQSNIPGHLSCGEVTDPPFTLNIIIRALKPDLRLTLKIMNLKETKPGDIIKISDPNLLFELYDSKINKIYSNISQTQGEIYFRMVSKTLKGEVDLEFKNLKLCGEKGDCIFLKGNITDTITSCSADYSVIPAFQHYSVFDYLDSLKEISTFSSISDNLIEFKLELEELATEFEKVTDCVGAPYTIKKGVLNLDQDLITGCNEIRFLTALFYFSLFFSEVNTLYGETNVLDFLTTDFITGGSAKVKRKNSWRNKELFIEKLNENFLKLKENPEFYKGREYFDKTLYYLTQIRTDKNTAEKTLINSDKKLLEQLVELKEMLLELRRSIYLGETVLPGIYPQMKIDLKKFFYEPPDGSAIDYDPFFLQFENNSYKIKPVKAFFSEFFNHFGSFDFYEVNKRIAPKALAKEGVFKESFFKNLINQLEKYSFAGKSIKSVSIKRVYKDLNQ